MIELTSLAGLRRQKDFIKKAGMGHMRTAVPLKHFRVPKDGQPWGFDNGKYASDTKGTPWPEEDFLKALNKISKTYPPFMAVVPDIVKGGNSSLEFSRKWRSRLSGLGYDWLPWYLAVQDGMEIMDVLEELGSGRYRGIFVGGSRSFKFQLYPDWPVVAAKFGLNSHLAGIYHPHHQAYARDRGYDSIDSTGWARNDNMEEKINLGRRTTTLLNVGSGPGSLIRHATRWYR